MTASVIGALRVNLGLDSARFQAGMQDARGRLAKFGSEMGAMGKAWAGGLVGGLLGGLAAAGVTGVITQIGQVAKGVAQVGDEARRAGVSAKAFQEWKFVAEQNRIPIDAMIDGLKELNLRADEFAITGKGSAAEAFARLGYGAEEVKRKLEDPNELLLEIIGRLQQMDKAAQIRISDELFGGTGGERFVELLAQGEEGIRRTIAEANALGIVMDDELIAKAAEVDRQFNIVANTVGSALKSAIVTAAAALADFISQFRSFQSQSAGVLRGNLATVQADLDAQEAALATLEADASDLRNAAGSDPMAAAMLGGRENVLAEARAARDAARAQRDAMRDRLDQIDPPVQFGPPAPGAPAPAAGGWTPPEYVPPPASSGGGGGGGGGGKGSAKRPDDFQREVQQIEKRTAALKAGAAAQAEINPLVDDFGRAAEFASARTELLLAAQEAGLPITEALRAQVDQLAGAYADASAASEALDEAQAAAVDAAQRAADLRRDVIGGFASDLRDGVSAADALASALSRVSDRLFDMALDGLFGGAGGGGGGFWGAISGLFGGFRIPGFADGTWNAPGGLAWVGERGRELVNLPKGSQVIPNHRLPDLVQEPRDVRVLVGVDPKNGSVTGYVDDRIDRATPGIQRGAVGAVQTGARKSRKFLGR